MGIMYYMLGSSNTVKTVRSESGLRWGILIELLLETYLNRTLLDHENHLSFDYCHAWSDCGWPWLSPCDSFPCRACIGFTPILKVTRSVFIICEEHWSILMSPAWHLVTFLLCFLLLFFYFTVRHLYWQIRSSCTWLTLYSSRQQTQHIATALFEIDRRYLL